MSPVHRGPLHPGELIQTPLFVESADAGLLGTTESDDRLVMDRGVVDVGHLGLDLVCVPYAMLDDGGEILRECGVPVLREWTVRRVRMDEDGRTPAWLGPSRRPPESCAPDIGRGVSGDDCHGGSFAEPQRPSGHTAPTSGTSP